MKKNMKPTVTPLLQIDKLSDDELLELLPREKISAVLGDANIRWAVLKTPPEIQAVEMGLISYNTCAAADTHYRVRDVPDHKNPLVLYHAEFINRVEYAHKMQYSHNQIMIEGRLAGERCAELHLAPVYPSSLYLNDIYLANPSKPAKTPLGPDQKYEGLGNGIFDVILGRLQAFGKKYGFRKLLAYAAYKDQAEIFLRHGFLEDRSDLNLWSLSQVNGMQIPIFIPLK